MSVVYNVEYIVYTTLTSIPGKLIFKYFNIDYIDTFNPFHPIRPYMASMQPLPIMMAIFLGYLWTVSHIFNL